MQPLKLAAAALNQTPLDWVGNERHILAAIETAREDNVAVLCLPELCVTGYGCEDAFHSPGVIRTAHDVLAKIVPATTGIAVAVGLPVFYRGGLYDAAAMVCDGQLLGIACKQNLAGDGIHYEPRWFRRWSAGAVADVSLGGTTVPIGDLVFDCDGVRIGFEICEDAWVADRPGRNLARRGVDVILNPSASHFAFGKQQVRERFVLEGSRAFHVSYVYANLLGNEAGRAIYDGGSMIASGGKMLARGPRFSYADWRLTSAIVDVDATRQSHARSAVDPDEAVSPGGKTIVARGAQIGIRGSDLPPPVAPAPENPGSTDATGYSESGFRESRFLDSKEEEFARAVPLALFDYLRKSRSGGFVVSLSGGADSATVALVVWLAVRLGVEELGRDGFLAKLEYLRNAGQSAPDARSVHAGQSDPDAPSLHAGQSDPDAPSGRVAGDVRVAGAGDVVRELLTCVYQATRNSTETTRQAARGVAEAIGAEFITLDVDALVEGYKRTVSEAIGRELDWSTDDLALQNIQARARGPSVWLLANLRGALLLTTSNRSEAAVGYATMDGDTCGGLAPIAGIDKAFLRRWLRWMERTGPEGIGPLPALAAVNAQQPTAELRPPDAAQTDEGDLMPYDLLDVIERAAIRDKRVPVEVFETVRTRFPEQSLQQLGAWVERFFRLWCRNQWKRERYAPSFHLDDENLDPKTWCRFPILSGGYERELAELQAQIACLLGSAAT